MRHARWFFVGILVFVLGIPAGWVWAGPTVIKVAVVTPEGSAWVNVLREMVAEIQTRTHDEITFKIYAGGVSGDEADVLRKMQANRIQAAGFSGVGMGVVLPQLRVLEAPLLFQDDAEIDAIRETMFDYFAAALEKKGFVLLGFAEGGWVYLFSKRNLSDDQAFKSAKMWVWEGDRVAETLLDSFGVRTTPLNIADVTTGLETGMIDSFYSPPLAAIAFQWFTRVDYMLDYPLADSTGALIMTRRAFEHLPEAHQDILRRVARAHCQRLVEMTRRDNQAAKEALKAQGITFVQPSEKQIAAFYEDARTTYTRSIPELYSQDLFDRIVVGLKELRTVRNAPPHTAQ
jgi:TRAP-type C4-dicarboxylate transport system substrate-binding protein